ncbi:MAG: metal ABC transporter permease [Pseudomonadota bacterium]
MLDALSYDFIQHAIMAAVLASIACGIIGTLVVVNRLTFLAGGVAHAAYGGIGIAVYAGLPFLPCTIIFSLASSLIMARLSFRHHERADAAIGVLWAAGMALGIILLDLTEGYRADFMSFLFGSILTVPMADLYFMLAVDAILLLIIACTHQALLVVSFDRDFAEARGLPVRALHMLIIAMAAITIVMLMRVVGLILIMALLTIPSFMARTASSLPAMMLRSSLWALFFCLTGLALSYEFDISSGAAIIAVAVISFGLKFLLKFPSQLDMLPFR